MPLLSSFTQLIRKQDFQFAYENHPVNYLRHGKMCEPKQGKIGKCLLCKSILAMLLKPSKSICAIYNHVNNASKKVREFGMTIFKLIIGVFWCMCMCVCVCVCVCVCECEVAYLFDVKSKYFAWKLTIYNGYVKIYSFSHTVRCWCVQPVFVPVLCSVLMVFVSICPNLISCK